MKKSHYLQSGQTLVTLLVFSVISLATASAAVAVMINTTRNAGMAEHRIVARHTAEAGAENALLRLIRNPNYAGETLSIDGGTATIVVSGTSPKTIVSTSTSGGITQAIEVIANYINNQLTVTSWRTVY